MSWGWGFFPFFQKEALDRGGPQLRNFSTEELLGSGVPGHPRLVSIQGWFLAGPNKRVLQPVSRLEKLLDRGPRNGAFGKPCPCPRDTRHLFVILVVSRGSSSKALVLVVRMQIRHFRHFRQNPPFSGGTKARFTKSTVFGTLSEVRGGSGGSFRKGA